MEQPVRRLVVSVFESCMSLSGAFHLPSLIADNVLLAI